MPRNQGAEVLIDYMKAHAGPVTDPGPHAAEYCDFCRKLGLKHRPGTPAYCCHCGQYHREGAEHGAR